MPKDHHLRARDRDIAKRAGLEVAINGSYTNFESVYNDLFPSVESTKKKKRKKKAGTKQAKPFVGAGQRSKKTKLQAPQVLAARRAVRSIKPVDRAKLLEWLNKQRNRIAPTGAALPPFVRGLTPADVRVIPLLVSALKQTDEPNMPYLVEATRQIGAKAFAVFARLQKSRDQRVASKATNLLHRLGQINSAISVHQALNSASPSLSASKLGPLVKHVRSASIEDSNDVKLKAATGRRPLEGPANLQLTANTRPPGTSRVDTTARLRDAICDLPTKKLKQYASGQIKCLPKKEKELKGQLRRVAETILKERRAYSVTLQGQDLMQLRNAVKSGGDVSRRVAAYEIYARTLLSVIRRLSDEHLRQLTEEETAPDLQAALVNEARRRNPKPLETKKRTRSVQNGNLTWRDELQALEISKLESVVAAPPPHWPPAAVYAARQDLTAAQLLRQKSTQELCALYSGVGSTPLRVDRRLIGKLLGQRDPSEVRHAMQNLPKPRPEPKIVDLPENVPSQKWV